MTTAISFAEVYAIRKLETPVHRIEEMQLSLIEMLTKAQYINLPLIRELAGQIRRAPSADMDELRRYENVPYAQMDRDIAKRVIELIKVLTGIDPLESVSIGSTLTFGKDDGVDWIRKSFPVKESNEDAVNKAARHIQLMLLHRMLTENTFLICAVRAAATVPDYETKAYATLRGLHNTPLKALSATSLEAVYLLIKEITGYDHTEYLAGLPKAQS